MAQKYTKQEITQMADRCYRRCWHCDRYEPCGNIGYRGTYLFDYSGSGCYEAHDLPWESGHWCPFWGDKNHPDSKILRSLTWNNVTGRESFFHLPEDSNTLRGAILNANPEIASKIQYCDNSNESRDKYFNKPENAAFLNIFNIGFYCETLRRYRFSHVDSRALYPGANEWIRPMIVCYDRETYKSIDYLIVPGDGIQISFACSPERNYQLGKEIFFYDEEKKQIIAEFNNAGNIVGTYCMSLANVKGL